MMKPLKLIIHAPTPSALARQGLKAAGQQVTPAAVVMIAELQAEGWGYMRA